MALSEVSTVYKKMINLGSTVSMVKFSTVKVIHCMWRSKVNIPVSLAPGGRGCK